MLVGLISGVSIMLALILNAIYRQFLKAALAGMANKRAQR